MAEHAVTLIDCPVGEKKAASRSERMIKMRDKTKAAQKLAMFGRER